ncbi:hypothetical protein [Nostoc sp.]
MLNAQEFDNWCHRLKISGQARSVIEQIRSSEPVRRARTNGINVVSSYSNSRLFLNFFSKDSQQHFSDYGDGECP